MQKTGLLIVVGTLALAATVLYFSSLNRFSPSQAATTISGVGCSSYSNSFTIVASQSGYNDSIAHRAPGEHWPVLCTHAGELVRITIVNRDTVEPHGFAVAGYLDAGVTVLPGQSITISIFASSPGDFKIYCDIICAVHLFMQSGLLVVAG